MDFDTFRYTGPPGKRSLKSYAKEKSQKIPVVPYGHIYWAVPNKLLNIYGLDQACTKVRFDEIFSICHKLVFLAFQRPCNVINQIKLHPTRTRFFTRITISYKKKRGKKHISLTRKKVRK